MTTRKFARRGRRRTNTFTIDAIRPLMAAAAFAALVLQPAPSRALSELQQSDVQPMDSHGDVDRAPLDEPPMVDKDEPDAGKASPLTPVPESGEAGDEAAPSSDLVRPDADAAEKPPEVLYDLDRLPEPVRRMHDLIVEACKSGDLEKLRPLLGTGADATQISLGPLGEDPIKFLRELSGDEGGQEILAILLEVMQSGYVHLNEGEPSEIYAWPYFFAMPLDKLTPPQRVELFKLITAGDYEDMKNFGAYIFYRAAITPEGKWLFFVAGD